MADTSVREAGPGDVAAAAEVQVATWREAYGPIVPAAVLAALDTAAVEAGWRDALTDPPDPRARLLLALAEGRVVGLAAVAPATDEDLDDARWAELGPLLVLPGARGAGHGSRLLAAAADLLAADGFRYAVCWVFEADTVSRGFLEASGWAVDGATRVLDLGGERVREIRLHTAFADD